MSEWKQGAAKRRDARNTALPAIRPPSGSKKNTKKWCRGKAGVEHKPVCRDWSEVKNVTYMRGCKLLICAECSKQLAWWFPWPGTKSEPPAWAAESVE